MRSSYFLELRRVINLVGVLGVTALTVVGVVLLFRWYEGRLEVERERVRGEVLELSVALERQTEAVYSAEERARNARALLERVRDKQHQAEVERATLLLNEEREKWEAIQQRKLRGYEKLRGRDSLMGSDR